MQRGTGLIWGFAGVTAMGVALAASPSQAALIGIDFGATGSTMTLSDEAGAPGLRQQNWNAAAPNSNLSPGVNLMTSTGATGAGNVRWTTDGGSPIAMTPLTNDRMLFSSSLYSDAAAGVTTATQITVTGLTSDFSAGGYRLVLYYDASNAGVNTGEMFADIDFGNNGSVDLTQRYYNSNHTFNGTTFNYGYIEYAPADPNGHSNFVQTASTGSAGTNGFKITLRTPDGSATTQRTVITGLQIVSVPEPATLGLLGLGGIMMLRRQRRVN